MARANGHPEAKLRGLRDLHELIAVARAGGVGLWLHGHRHDAYRHEASGTAPIPSLCAGSTTQRGRWSYGEYVVEGGRLIGVRRGYDEAQGRFVASETFEVGMAGTH